LEGAIEKGTVGDIKEDIKPAFSEITKFINMKTKKILKLIAIAIIALTVIFFWGEEIEYALKEDTGSVDEYYEESEDYGEYYEEECNVIGIELRGFLATYHTNEEKDAEGNPTLDQSASEEIVAGIEMAEEDDTVRAIVLEIDSSGGYPVAAEEVANALKRAKKLTVAIIRGFGDSAAYWAATGADVIFASKNSDVGSIGVTMSYMDYAKQNQEEGLNYNSLTSGKFKDAGDPDKALTYEERQLFMRDVNILNENFIQDVAKNRNMDIERVRELADGSSWLGAQALEYGLIDRIGGFFEAKEYLKELVGEEIDICW